MECRFKIQVKTDLVPCGRCNFCLQKKRAQWAFRLYEETKAAESATFLTLTYNEESAPRSTTGEPILEKRDLQLFLKAVRNREWRKHRRKKIRYYGVGEYGSETSRPHYHMLLYNFHQDTLGTIADIWGKGHVHMGEVEPASINYVSGYIINEKGEVAEETRVFPFAVMSKGIGRQYLTLAKIKYHRQGKKDFGTMPGGVKVGLPTYYRDKIFSKHAKAVMKIRAEKEKEARYWKRIEAISAFHPWPEWYYQEMVDDAYKRVKTQKKTRTRV